jgi:hypothetical protein
MIIAFVHLLLIESLPKFSITIMRMSKRTGSQSVSLPPLTGVAHRRQAFAELRLLAFSFPLLIRLARLLFGAGTWGATAEERDKECRNQKCLGRELLHIRIKKTTIIAAIDRASSLTIPTLATRITRPLSRRIRLIPARGNFARASSSVQEFHSTRARSSN